MNRLIRLFLVVAMLALAWQLVIHYAFDYRKGYPFWPLLGLALTYHLFASLPRVDGSKKRPLSYDHQSFDHLLLHILSLVGALAILHFRGESPFQFPWVCRVAILTLFLYLVPRLLAAPFYRGNLLVTALGCIGLIGLLLWKGSLSGSNAAAPQRNSIEANTAPTRSSASSRLSLKAS